MRDHASTGGDEMTDEAHTAQAPRSRPGPEVVAPTNRVNVAFPFSKITVQEPSKEFAELAAIVAELAVVMEAAAVGPEIKKLRERAQALAIASRRG
jgi:hypothetical protein